MTGDRLTGAYGAPGAHDGRQPAAQERAADLARLAWPEADGVGPGRRVVDAPTVVQPATAAPTVQPATVDAPTVLMVRGDSPTSVIAAIPSPPPVFVDPSGRRRSRLRWIAYGLGLAGALYTGLVAASFVGAPVNSETVLPFVEPTRQQQPWQPPPAPSLPAVAPTSATPTRPAAPVVSSGGTTRASATPSRAVTTVPSRVVSSPSAEPRPSRSTPAAPPPSIEPPSTDPSPVIDPPPSPDVAARVDG
ncbi:hypothetical protein E0H26_12395 [Micromonospora zingiberis]|uniref:Uncharacterized protein n=1 Tax=Micromonospora zingiberis TaxID=2053011 RepID=A0A4R0GMK4_9ACTN|nr:hypothetical protein [Micromonospora zingiberis]TCB97693.1 hypothetical protein E0H26_12395 [Micromonospora zingiberis]